MIGSSPLGTRWIGSGRSQRNDYRDLSAAMVVGLSLLAEVRGAGRPMSCEFHVGSDMDGGVVRTRGVSAAFNVAVNLDVAAARVRSTSASFDLSASLSGSAARLRPMSGNFLVSAGLDWSAARLRPMSATFDSYVDMQGETLRLRPMSAAFEVGASLSGDALRGRVMAGSFTVEVAMAAGGVRTFFKPGRAGRFIFVPPKQRDIPVPERDRVIIFAGDDLELSMQERVKQPREVVDYTIDMRRYFRSIFTDFITAVDVEIDVQGDADDLESGPGVQPTWAPVGDPVHQVKLWFGGGRDGVTYQVTAVVTTQLGRVEKVDFLIRVERQTQ